MQEIYILITKISMGSKVIFEDQPDETSWSVLKWEEQGAIIMGKLSMHGK